jgi:hypothetical protein
MNNLVNDSAIHDNCGEFYVLFGLAVGVLLGPDHWAGANAFLAKRMSHFRRNRSCVPAEISIVA